MNKTVLNNGFTILSSPNPNAVSATLSIFVNAGSHDEANYPKGIAHFIEHMLFKGTTNRSAAQINEEMDFIGGVTNAYTSSEVTNYHCLVSYDKWKIGADLLLDMLWNSTFPEEEITKERKVILEEIKMYEDDPADFSFELLLKHIFIHEEERQSIIGTAESVSSITREDILSFVTEFYQPNNLLFVATGNVDHDALVEFISSKNATRTGITQKNPASYVQKSFPSTTISFAKDIQQAHLSWATGAPSLSSEESYVMDVVASLLGGGMSSRLFKAIREDKGLAYSVQAYPFSGKDYGLFCGYVGTDAHSLAEVKTIILHELNRLKTDPLSDYELQKAINYTIGQKMLSLQSDQALNDSYGISYLQDNLFDFVSFKANTEKVTKTDVQLFAQKYFGQDKTLFSQVVPKN